MPFRTDLAMESAQPHIDSLPAGITQSEHTVGNLTINTVEITSDDVAKLIGKPCGKFITIITPPFHTGQDADSGDIEAIAKEITSFLPQSGLVLIVGLGNNDITPDAIGPRTAHGIIATRHISGEAAVSMGFEGLRPVAAVAPGVLGQTGIETSEIISSIVHDIKPAAVIVIDALAAGDMSRLGNTVQISNTGISPGSGVKNHRRELSENTLGVPVISVGIPTVVDALTVASALLGEDESKLSTLKSANNMMITPREIDVLISRACKTLAQAINRAVQPALSLEEINYLA